MLMKTRPCADAALTARRASPLTAPFGLGLDATRAPGAVAPGAVRARPASEPASWGPARVPAPRAAAVDRDPVMAACADAPPQVFEPEQRLYAGGSLGVSAWIINAGIVRFERVTGAGERRITRVAGRGDLIGQEALLRLRFRDDAVACTPLILQHLPLNALGDGGGAPAALAQALMQHWQAALDEAEFWASEVTTGSARRRVLQLLARLAAHTDAAGRVWLPKRDQMGDMLGITIETCSRCLSALRREGIVDLLPPRHAALDCSRLATALVVTDR